MTNELSEKSGSGLAMRGIIDYESLKALVNLQSSELVEGVCGTEKRCGWQWQG